MYRGSKIEPISLPEGFNSSPKKYKIFPVSSNIITNNISKVVEETFDLRDENGNLFSPSDKEKILLTDFPEQEFEYHKCIFYKPIDIRDERSTTPGYPRYKFRDVFNYRPPEYIEYISKNSELDIPNFYLSVENEGNDKYASSFSLDGNLKTRDTFLKTNLYIKSKNLRTQEAIDRTKKILLTKNANQYKEGIDLNGDNSTDITSLRNLFPFAVNMELNYVDQDYYTNAIDQFKLHQSLLDYIFNKETQGINLKVTNVDFENAGQPQEVTLGCWDFDDYLSTLFFKKYYDYVILPDIKNESIYAHNIKKFKSNFYFQTTNDIPASFNTVKQKRTTPSELLYFKIEKFLGKNAAGEPLQTFYMSGNSSRYEYYDTQVKNKKYYTYRITGVYMSSGLKYRFIHNQNGTFTYEARRSRKIIEYPVLTKTVYVLQPLPHVPDVFPYKHKEKNKIYFYLRLSNTNKKYIPFQPISENDNKFIDILNVTKQYENPEHAYVAESAKFEVYKTTTRPSKLSDLRESFLLETRTIRDRTDHLFVDHIEYEKDYYYLFRAVNNENFPGNPTKLFKVRMQRGVEENKVEIQRMDFLQTPEEYDVKRNFNKLFHIFPHGNQNVMTNLKEITGDSYINKLSSVNVGLEGVPRVWDKKFKMRITSNNTGKKIDFNVKFSIKRKTLETE